MVPWRLPICFRPKDDSRQAKLGPGLVPPRVQQPRPKAARQPNAAVKQATKQLTAAASQGNLASMLDANLQSGGGHEASPHPHGLTPPAAPTPPAPPGLQGYSSSYSSRGPAGSKSNGSDAGASLCSMNSKSPSVATRCTAPTPGSNIFELSTSGLLAQRRACILRPMASAYARSSETDIVKTLAHWGQSTKGSVEGSEHEYQQRQGSGLGLPRAFSVGSCLSRHAGSAGGSSSLMMASFARMQGHLIEADAVASAAAASGSSAGHAVAAEGSGPMDSQASSARLSISAEDEATARRFAEAYLQAVTTGDGNWASQAAVQEAFDDNAKLCTHDGQKYHGRTAVINRLNQGMQQFLKMVGHQAGGADPDTKLSKLHTQLEIKVVLPARRALTDGAAGSPGHLRKGARALNLWVRRLVPGKHHLRSGRALQQSGSSASLSSMASTRIDRPAASSLQPSIVAVYTFKYGIRRMTVTDTLRFKQGRIARMKRVFKL